MILLLHGYSDHSHDRIATDAQKFTTLGYSSYTMDHEGHGLSEGLRGYIENFDHLVADVTYYIDIIKSQNPGKKLFLYGQSMGGALGILATLQDNKICDGLVLVAPMVKVVDSMRPHPAIVFILKILARIFPRWAVVPVADLVDKGIKMPEKRAVVRANPLGYNGRLRLATGLAILQVTSFLQENMHLVDLPLLICHGTDDMVTSTEVSKELYKLAKTPDKTLKLYDGMWHAITDEPDSHLVFQDIATWITEHVNDDRVDRISLEDIELMNGCDKIPLETSVEGMFNSVQKKERPSDPVDEDTLPLLGSHVVHRPGHRQAVDA